MNDDQRIEELFQQAADLPSAERKSWLAGQCPDEPGLVARVEALLARLDDGGSLARPGIAADPDEAEVSEGPGSIIGRYKLLERIGEGGFGVVYMAEQLEPVVRRVALKIIKRGMDTREVVARFEAERQALAMMDHANIARVLDGGATETGRPYFVMELVRGVSITEFCDQSRLATRDRIELLREVCQAVQHAHQKGVIHRDLKPTNVLVTLHDGRPVPKVIDFGIAKAMHARLTEKTLFTRYQQFIGTPAYMSPEQAEMSGLDVDTRTDIYSLGVLLYELLTGSTPFDTKVLWEAGFSEVQRVIRDEPPERPSVRISTTGDVQIAARRRLDLAGLSRSLRGDLDWIVLKTLEKDRARRYSSAGELADDLQRHLQNEPVLAGEPSRIYRLRKFAARNRALVTSAMFVTVALVIGIVGTSLGMLEASRQRDAVAREAGNVREVTDFLIGLLSLTDPQFAMSPEVSVRALLDRASAEIAGAFSGQPEAEARVRSTIGQAYLSLGEHDVAEIHLKRAVQIQETLGGADLAGFYQALWALTNVSFKLERADSFAWAGRARRVGLDHIRESHVELAASLGQFHDEVENSAHLPDPEPLLRAAASVPPCLLQARAVLVDRDPLWAIVAQTFMSAGYWLWYTPHEQIGAEFFEAALQIQARELDPGHPGAAESMAVQAGILNRAGRSAEAEGRIRTVTENLRGVVLPGSFQLAFVESVLGENLTYQAQAETDPTRAEELFVEAESFLKPSHQVLVAGVPRVTDFYAVDSFGRMAFLYHQWGKPEEADPYRAELAARIASADVTMAWSLVRRAFPAEHEELARHLDQLNEELHGVSYALGMAAVDVSHVTADVDALVRLRKETLAPGDPEAGLIARALLSYSQAVDPAEELCRQMAQEAYDVLLTWQAEVPMVAAVAASRLAEVCQAHGESEEARRLMREALRLLESAMVDENWYTNVQRARVGRGLVTVGMHPEAETVLLRSRKLLREHLGSEHPSSQSLNRLLVDLYESWGRPETARLYRKQGG